MTHRNPKPSDFVGKTIARVDTRSINIWVFHFTDGTKTAVEVDAFGGAGYGMVVCDHCTTPDGPSVDGQIESALRRVRDGWGRVLPATLRRRGLPLEDRVSQAAIAIGPHDLTWPGRVIHRAYLSLCMNGKLPETPLLRQAIFAQRPASEPRRRISIMTHA